MTLDGETRRLLWVDAVAVGVCGVLVAVGVATPAVNLWAALEVVQAVLTVAIVLTASRAVRLWLAS